MSDEKNDAKTRDDGWRLEPRERLFAVREREEGEATSAEIASDAMLRCLAEGRVPREESQVAFAGLLAEAVVGDEEAPLAGFSDLYSALQADYAYSDADHHLEGYSEGMLYGMLRLADLIVEELDSRGESFLPASVLTHPDVLLASCLSQTMSASRISEMLGTPVQDVLRAAVDLGRERIVVQSICGRNRFFFPSRRGEEFAKRLRETAEETVTEVGDDPVAVADALMRAADFPEWEAVYRATLLLMRETDLAAETPDSPRDETPEEPEGEEEP